MRAAVTGLAGLAFVVACGPSSRDGDGQATPDANTNTTGADAGECREVIDVVFVLDTSSSMDFVLTQLQSQIADVVTASNAIAADAHFGLIAFQDNYALDSTGDLDNGLVHTSAASLQTAFAHYRTTYSNNDRNPGDGPSGPTLQNPICEENALDSLYAAASDFPWRDNATRVVILATDDTFLEAPDNYGDKDGDGDTTDTSFPSEGDYPALRTVPETITALQTAKVRVFSFTRLSPPNLLQRCGTGRRFPWANITDGWTTPYGAHPPIPQVTDGGNYDLASVQSGSLNLATTINEVVLDSHCNPILL